METCNKRREKKELEVNFKNIDFSELDSDTDQMWREDRFETIEELDQRIEDFKNLLKKLDDENVAVVSHSSFLKQMLYGTIGDDSNQLNHCDPYKFDISK